MASTPAESSEAQASSSVRERAVDAVRHVAHISHEAQLLKTLASDAVEDGAHAVKRAMKSVRRGAEQVEDFRDDAEYWIKRQPWKAVAIGAGSGLLIGVAIGLIAGRLGTRQRTSS